MKIALSELDEKRFGIATAKISFEGNESWDDVLAWCGDKRAELLIARIPTEQIRLVQQAEQAGAFFTDTLVYFRKNISRTAGTLPIELPKKCSWRVATPEDAKSVGNLAETVFAGYAGHYHADDRLKKSDCDLVYSSWAVDLCLYKHCADVVFLIESEFKTVGFLAIKQSGTDSAEIVLNGVHPDFQGHGVYRSLILLAREWAMQEQIKALVISTQITNLAVQKVWCRQGFEPYKSFYTFHKWFAK